MNSPARAPTGIAGFDAISGGGLPSGRATLRVGGPGSGKTVIALQCLARGATGSQTTTLAAAMVRCERVSSGISRLDTMLGGGFYRGASVLPVIQSRGTTQSNQERKLMLSDTGVHPDAEEAELAVRPKSLQTALISKQLERPRWCASSKAKNGHCRATVAR